MVLCRDVCLFCLFYALFLTFLGSLFHRWTNFAESHRSGLAVFEATIPTGYVVQQQLLDAYVKSKVVRNLRRARFFPKKVIFYFDFVSIRYFCCRAYSQALKFALNGTFCCSWTDTIFVSISRCRGGTLLLTTRDIFR